MTRKGIQHVPQILKDVGGRRKTEEKPAKFAAKTVNGMENHYKSKRHQ